MLKTVRMLGVVAVLMVPTVSAEAADHVTFGTNWLAEAEHGGFYQALVDGTYAKYGLDVTILPGGPQSNNLLLLPAGKIEFYMGDDMLQGYTVLEQKVPIVAVSAIMQKDPQIVMSHPGVGLDKFEDLKSATIFVSKGAIASFYRWMEQAYGFSEDKVKPYTFNTGPFIADTHSAQQGFLTSEPFAVEKQGGFKPNVFLLADYGFSTYATTVLTTMDMVKSKPAVVQRFVDASAIGWYNYLYGDNSKANAAIKKDNPDITDEEIAFAIAKMKEYGIVDSGDTKELGIGAMTDAKQKDFFDKMVKAGVVSGDLDYKQAYTLQFVNKKVGLDLAPKTVTAVVSRNIAARPGPDERLVVLRGVSKSFPNGTLALSRLDLEIRDGEFLSLIGPSGCGKSTALRLLAGLVAPTAGEIAWTGARPEIGFVFQEPTLMPWASVFDNVFLPLRLRRVSRRAAAPRIEEAVARVGLSKFMRYYPRELSGGMKMRVSIARALVLRPRLLLMDEPFAALDEITRFRLNDDLVALKNELGTTIVFVTHSVYESVYLSSRIVVMASRPGRIIDSIDVPEPMTRTEEFRTTPLYNETCRRASHALHGAMSAEDHL